MDFYKIIQKIIGYFNKYSLTVNAIYLSGSYANGYAIKGISDLDLLVLIDEYDDNIVSMINECFIDEDIELDFCVLKTSDIYEKPTSIDVRESVMSSKLCGQLLFGEDVLNHWELPDIENYTHRTIEMVHEFICRAHGENWNDRKLEYPEKDDKYRGYIIERGGFPSTKQLISLYTWIATARLGKYKKLYCGCKQQCIDLYCEMFNDEFSDCLKKVYDDCRKNWGYLLPDDLDSQERLSKYCTKLLMYEREFIEECRAF